MNQNIDVTDSYHDAGADIPPPDDEVASSMLADVLADVLAGSNGMSTGFNTDIPGHEHEHEHGHEYGHRHETEDGNIFEVTDNKEVDTKTTLKSKAKTSDDSQTQNKSEGTRKLDQHAAELKEQDRWLPINNVARLMKNTLPPTAKVSKDAKKCMQECVSEFISFVTSEAGDRCAADRRKTINGEDILISLHVLGFENYAEVLKIYLAKYRYKQALRNQQMLEGESDDKVNGSDNNNSSNSSSSSSSSSSSNSGGTTPNASADNSRSSAASGSTKDR